MSWPLIQLHRLNSFIGGVLQYSVRLDSASELADVRHWPSLDWPVVMLLRCLVGGKLLTERKRMQPNTEKFLKETSRNLYLEQLFTVERTAKTSL